jgi:hypothetical protein
LCCFFREKYFFSLLAQRQPEVVQTQLKGGRGRFFFCSLLVFRFALERFIFIENRTYLLEEASHLKSKKEKEDFHKFMKEKGELRVGGV